MILIIGVILRFKGLTFQSHWLDELFSASTSNHANSFNDMLHRTLSDVHPPLYQTLLWLWYKIFGFTEIAGRSLSAVIGSLGIVSIYYLGKELFNKYIGLYAALIASMNHFLIFYSQETRSYALLFLFSTLSYLYFIKVIKDQEKSTVALYLLLTIALCYTHYFGFFLVATQVFVFLFYIIKLPEKRKQLFIIATVTAFFIIVSLLPIAKYIFILEAKTSIWIDKPSFWFVKNYITSYFRSNHLIALFLVCVLMSFVYLFKKVDEDDHKTKIILLLIWIATGYLLPYIRSVTATPLLTSRNTIIVLPALIILISSGIYLFKNKQERYVILSTIIFFSLYQIYNHEYYSKVTKEQWREVLLDVSNYSNRIPAYDIVFRGNNYLNYSKMLDLDLNISPFNALKKSFEEQNVPECFWVLDSHGNHIAQSELLKNECVHQVMELKHHAAKGILYSYGVDPSLCQTKTDLMPLSQVD